MIILYHDPINKDPHWIIKSVHYDHTFDQDPMNNDQQWIIKSAHDYHQRSMMIYEREVHFT